jgi:hypothetical protein
MTASTAGSGSIAVRDLQVDPVDRRDAAEVLAQLLQLDRRHAREYVSGTPTNTTLSEALFNGNRSPHQTGQRI